MLVPVTNNTINILVYPNVQLMQGQTYVNKQALDALKGHPVFEEQVRRGQIVIEGWEVDMEAVKKNSQPYEAAPKGDPLKDKSIKGDDEGKKIEVKATGEKATKDPKKINVRGKETAKDGE